MVEEIIIWQQVILSVYIQSVRRRVQNYLKGNTFLIVIQHLLHSCAVYRSLSLPFICDVPNIFKLSQVLFPNKNKVSIYLRIFSVFTSCLKTRKNQVNSVFVIKEQFTTFSAIFEVIINVNMSHFLYFAHTYLQDNRRSMQLISLEKTDVKWKQSIKMAFEKRKLKRILLKI